MEQNDMAELQMLPMQLQQMQSYLQTMEEQLQEITAAASSVEELQSMRKGDDVLAPLTNGIFVKTTLDEKEMLLVNVGAGVILEKTPEETNELLMQQKGEVERYYQQVIEQFTTMYQRYMELQIRMEQGDK